MQQEIDDKREQLMADVLPTVAKLVDEMMADLPESAQGHIVELLNAGARLGLTMIALPYPTFKLVVIPPNPQDPLVELSWCSPSSDTVRALQRETVAH